MKHKLYGDLQLLPILTNCLKDFLIDFVTGLLISIDWKGESYNSILVIINQLTKRTYYELVIVNIDTLGLAEVILNMIIYYYNFSNSIIFDRGSLFILKF